MRIGFWQTDLPQIIHVHRPLLPIDRTLLTDLPEIINVHRPLLPIDRTLLTNLTETEAEALT